MKKQIPEKLTVYGFLEENGQFLYKKEILDGEFTLTVRILEDETVNTDLVEKETGEPYVLYKTNASGAFVGEVRIAIEQVLEEIAEHCYETGKVIGIPKYFRVEASERDSRLINGYHYGRNNSIEESILYSKLFTNTQVKKVRFRNTRETETP